MYLAVIDDVKSATWEDIAKRPESHRKILNNIQIYAIKILPHDWFNSPTVMDILFHAREEHPSNLRRAMRFRERIAELEKQERHLAMVNKSVPQHDQSVDAEIQQ